MASVAFAFSSVEASDSWHSDKKNSRSELCFWHALRNEAIKAFYGLSVQETV